MKLNIYFTDTSHDLLTDLLSNPSNSWEAFNAMHLQDVLRIKTNEKKDGNVFMSKRSISVKRVKLKVNFSMTLLY